jgi:hypothetical protein
LSYNVLLTTLKVNIVVKPIVLVAIAKLAWTCTNCGKTDHLIETCHNRKKKVPTIIIESTKPLIRTIKPNLSN